MLPAADYTQLLNALEFLITSLKDDNIAVIVISEKCPKNVASFRTS